jgi:hypothetical protein
MAEPKVKGDGSQRFLLKGGQHDARRNKKKGSGFHLRLYPDTYAKGYYVGKDFVMTTAAVFPDEVTYAGEVYGFPETQNEKEPFLERVRNADD